SCPCRKLDVTCQLLGPGAQDVEYPCSNGKAGRVLWPSCGREDPPRFGSNPAEDASIALGHVQCRIPMADGRFTRQLATIVSVDAVGFSRLIGLNPDLAVAAFEKRSRIILDTCRAFGGVPFGA